MEHVDADPRMPLLPLCLELTDVEPLHRYTGMTRWLGPEWPPDDAMSLVDLGFPDFDADFGWLVRSPWPAIGLAEVIRVLWRWVERPPYDTSDRALWLRRIGEAFSWDQTQALDWLERCRTEPA